MDNCNLSFPLNLTKNDKNNNSEDKIYSPSFDDLELKSQAAKKIQRLWRKYIDLQVFKYYKDLILFYKEGDPGLMMKYINPTESKFIDSASGIHIKFRLAGTQFPPTIYYKIFTHRPIQDLGSNAPRDYTRVKMVSSQMKNNKTEKIPAESYDGWYKRIENNGWRPVSTKHLLQMNMDYYYGIESRKVVFQHSKLLRKKDIELKRRIKKIEWMKKMYTNGIILKNSKNENENALVEEKVNNLIDIYKKDGPDYITDESVDEILEWTNTLNFKDYVENWCSLGTTSASDKKIDPKVANESENHSSTDHIYF